MVKRKEGYEEKAEDKAGGEGKEKEEVGCGGEAEIDGRRGSYSRRREEYKKKIKEKGKINEKGKEKT
jgi:hypothetical protein